MSSHRVGSAEKHGVTAHLKYLGDGIGVAEERLVVAEQLHQLEVGGLEDSFVAGEEHTFLGRPRALAAQCQVSSRSDHLLGPEGPQIPLRREHSFSQTNVINSNVKVKLKSSIYLQLHSSFYRVVNMDIYVMKCLSLSLQMYPQEDKDQEEAGSDQVRSGAAADLPVPPHLPLDLGLCGPV